MCRSIKTLRDRDVMATGPEIEAAALQFVRKVSGYRKPATKNADAFDAAVREIAAASEKLLAAITTGPDDARPLPPPRTHTHRERGGTVTHSHA